MFASGEIVPALEVLDAVQNATVQCAHTAPYYFVARDPTFAFACAVPFGMNARQQNAWMYHGGGLELMREFMHDYNVYNIPAGNTGAQMGGFFRKELRTVADLKGLRIVVDCANGAAYHVAPPVFHELGAEVIAIGNEPDGLNINAGVGSMHPRHLQEAVVSHKADLGLALDGDSDRLLMVDAQGRAYDGDQLLYIIALDYWRRGAMAGGVVGIGGTHWLSR